MEAMAYPVRLLGFLLSDAAIIGLAMLLWVGVYSQRSDVNGYSFLAMASYYLITLAMKNLTLSDKTADVIGDGVKSGSLSTFLVKPISYSKWILVQLTTEKLIRSVGPVCLLFLLVRVLGLPLGLPNNLILFVISLLLAILMNFLVSVLMGSLAFWLIDISGYVSVFYRAVNILNGGIFPLDLMPAWLVSVSNVLPFRYMHYLVVSIGLNRLTGEEALKQVGWQGVWLCILALIYKLVWKRGLRKYESIGT